MPEPITVTCARCRAEVPAKAAFCSACGTRLASEDLPTFSSPDPARRPGPSARPPGIPAPGAPKPSTPPPLLRSSDSAPSESRFPPGTLLAGRYRIVARVGRGGMGEVYRADDLTLGQPVALKFLPEAARNAETLARFRGEVRIARRVSHPNACRVYDIGEADGRAFISMEYVDGEDLASLLTRIGRLPSDKALEVARKVCAGLAAAHEKGVLHRDLKPSNVMLDSRGQVLITDFGLAALAEEIPEGDVGSGTPAYMAPEQLANKEVTVRSDVYSLGLVLYEVFTGKRAFEGKTLAEVVRARSESTPTSPSSLVKDLDPAVEGVILRCLERDPQVRPASVLAVAAALPGGDPLAAALAAGETPSPQVVADAGETTGLTPRAALARLATAFGGLGVVLVLSVRLSGLDKIGLNAPDALAQKARDTIRDLGYAAEPSDSAQGFSFEFELARHIETNDKPQANWDEVLPGRPSLVSYWYRISPRPMAVFDSADEAGPVFAVLSPGRVSPTHPPTTLSGMINVRLDAQGRLIDFQAIPPQKEDDPRESAAPGWAALFAAAGLDITQFQRAEPSWTSLAASDTRAAWTGTWPSTSRPLRVEAAAFHGRTVFFSLIGPWTRPSRMQPYGSTPGEKATEILRIVIPLSVLIGAVLLARRNYLQGRGDRRGALRLAVFVFCVEMALWACRGHFVAGVETLRLLLIALANSLFVSAVFWVLYLSLEPYVRRRWPQTIISWSRLVAGRLRDPLIGRDLLSGTLLGTLWALIYQIFLVAIRKRGAPPRLGTPAYLLGGRFVVGEWLAQLLHSIEGALAIFFILFVLRVVLRRSWLAGAVYVALFSAMNLAASHYLLAETPRALATFAIAAIAVMRYGFVALAAGLLTANLLLSVPVTADLSSWYAGSTAFVFLSVLALAGRGFYTSLGDQPLWKGELFE